MQLFWTIKQVEKGEDMDVIHKTLFDQVQLVLLNKLEEFREQQYNDIQLEDIWNYCITKKWKKRNVDEIHLHEIVATIFAIKPSDIINQAHLNELYKTDLNIGLDLEELKLLLNPLKSED